MHLWIILIATCIAVVCSEVPSTWFVRDTFAPQDDGDLFQEEHLLDMPGKGQHRSKRSVAGKSSSQKDSKTNLDFSKETRPSEKAANHKAVETNVESEELILVQNSPKPKPVSKHQQKKPVSKKAKKMPEYENQTLPKTGRRTLLFAAEKQPEILHVQAKKTPNIEIHGEDTLCDDPDDNVDCMFKEEELIPVLPVAKAKGKTKAASQKSTAKVTPSPQHAQAAKNSLPSGKKSQPKVSSKSSPKKGPQSNIVSKTSANKKDGDKVKAKVTSNSKTGSKLTDTITSGPHRKLMQTTGDRNTEQGETKKEESEGHEEDRQEEEVQPQDVREIEVTDLGEQLNQDDEDTDNVGGEDESDEEDMEEVFTRIRRQAGGSSTDSSESSGDDGSDDRFKDIHAVSNTGTTCIPFTIIFNNTKGSATLTLDEKNRYKQRVLSQLEDQYRGMPGFQSINIDVNNIRINANNRVEVTYSVCISGLQLGFNLLTHTQRVQAVQDYTRNNITLTDIHVDSDYVDPAYVDINALVNKVGTTLNNPCTQQNPCEFGYDTCTQTGAGTATCTHKCRSQGYNSKCQNGGVCSIDGLGNPYCQCNGYTGEFCQTIQNTGRQFTTPEIVGISVGAILAASALCGCCCFIIFCRKKSDVDMNYSYFGDENDPLQGFSDQTSKLSYNHYFDRPRVSRVPLDIYGLNGGLASHV